MALPHFLRQRVQVTPPPLHTHTHTAHHHSITQPMSSPGHRAAEGKESLNLYSWGAGCGLFSMDPACMAVQVRTPLSINLLLVNAAAAPCCCCYALEPGRLMEKGNPLPHGQAYCVLVGERHPEAQLDARLTFHECPNPHISPSGGWLGG